ncbi:hypothetical protein DY000_02021569 [Brassica cretica]|uniref:Uncharacterized protein n=1 Tax=Brassica cretica TaxID=69181 RepID=A0ABQ7EHQ8_BRACR|nr:hypothetical protein DY000_02021569 [Brassica cretica]
MYEGTEGCVLGDNPVLGVHKVTIRRETYSFGLRRNGVISGRPVSSWLPPKNLQSSLSTASRVKSLGIYVLSGVMRREEEEIARSMSSVIRIFVVKRLRGSCCVEFIPFETFSKHLFHYWEALAGREPSQLLSGEDYWTKQRKESGSKSCS